MTPHPREFRFHRMNASGRSIYQPAPMGALSGPGYVQGISAARSPASPYLWIKRSIATGAACTPGTDLADL